MSQLDLLKLMMSYGDETSLADFTPEELQEILRAFERGDEDLPMTEQEFKERYFAYYDDVKDKSLKKQDW